jgi:hypothetical protein
MIQYRNIPVMSNSLFKILFVNSICSDGLENRNDWLVNLACKKQANERSVPNFGSDCNGYCLLCRAKR